TAPVASTTQEIVVQVARATPAPTTRPVGEFRINRLLVTGADVLLEDHAVDPPLRIPINSMDVEVRDLSTNSLYEDRPIRFSAVLGSDKVKLPTIPSGSTPAT